MRPIAFALLALALAAPAHARGIHSHHRHSAYYTNVSGHRIHAPVHAARAPAGASAQCRDGSYSFSEHHQGTPSPPHLVDIIDNFNQIWGAPIF